MVVAIVVVVIGMGGGGDVDVGVGSDGGWRLSTDMQEQKLNKIRDKKQRTWSPVATRTPLGLQRGEESVVTGDYTTSHERKRN